MAGKNAWLATAMAALGGVALYRAHLQPWIYTWGVTEPEITAELPGDELVATGVPRTTRAVTIDASIESVWPWLAQIGEDRAGFYSYSVLERAVGARIHNADSIHPDWQDLAVGDTVWLARRYGETGRQVVAAFEPQAYLVLVSPRDFARLQRGENARGAWAFYLRRAGSWTRLLVRGSGGAVGHALFDIPHFVMEQKMLRGIRDRAQDAAAKGRAGATVRQLPRQRIAAPG